MNRKSASKLSLRRETLRNLSKQELKTAVGASYEPSECFSFCVTDLCGGRPKDSPQSSILCCSDTTVLD